MPNSTAPEKPITRMLLTFVDMGTVGSLSGGKVTAVARDRDLGVNRSIDFRDAAEGGGTLYTIDCVEETFFVPTGATPGQSKEALCRLLDVLLLDDAKRAILEERNHRSQARRSTSGN